MRKSRASAKLAGEPVCSVSFSWADSFPIGPIAGRT
jgi:hypothetical protein